MCWSINFGLAKDRYGGWGQDQVAHWLVWSKLGDPRSVIQALWSTLGDPRLLITVDDHKLWSLQRHQKRSEMIRSDEQSDFSKEKFANSFLKFRAKIKSIRSSEADQVVKWSLGESLEQWSPNTITANVSISQLSATKRMPVHRASNLLSALSLDLKIFKLAFKVILEGKIWLNSEICRFITQKSI